jgi:hypothetical protein
MKETQRKRIPIKTPTKQTKATQNSTISKISSAIFFM